jgi:TolB-like protein/Flp pilus assembly protein TadD
VYWLAHDRQQSAAKKVPIARSSGEVESSSFSTIPQKSVAVLPFVDMSEKKDQEYFSDGLSEELIDLLSKLTDVRVPARTSSFFFKGKSEDIAGIAQRLRVAHLLEGSVRKAGNTIRVTAQLVRADNGYHLWSETYDRELSDVFKIQDEIAGAVVAALKLKLAPGEQATNSHRTANSEAYTQYLLGRQLTERVTPESDRRAADAFRKALTLDPNYAPAYAELSGAESAVADLTGDTVLMKNALQAAERAVQLAPNQADGYTARGYLRFNYSWDWSGAQSDLEKALAIDPANSTLQRRYGLLLANLGRLDEGISFTRKAIDLDPLAVASWGNLAGFLMRRGEFDGARQAAGRALEIQEDSAYVLFSLGSTQLLEGNAQEALGSFRPIKDEDLQLCGIALAEHTLGHARESQRALEDLIAQDASHAAAQVAEVYAWRGEKDKAFEWLDRALRQHDGGLSDIKTDPFLVSLHGDERFTAFLRKMNFPTD